MAIQQDPSALLSAPPSTKQSNHACLTRTSTSYTPLHTFALPKGAERQYQQQYADMYFSRLAMLKPAIEKQALDAWGSFTLGGETARRVERVLDVRQGDLCWVIGTCYMEMPLKPNVLDDISKEHWIAAPPPRATYGATGGRAGEAMLEDESGRLRLTGSFLDSCMLVTGAIIAVLGTENKDGDFEALDLRLPDLAPQPERWEGVEGKLAMEGEKGKIAIVSGLGISGDEGDALALDVLMEYLLGEAATEEDQKTIATVSRLIIAGDALANASPIPSREEVLATKKAGNAAHNRKYGYDSSSYNAAPTDRLDTFLATLLPSIPITILPGIHDPTSTSLPQQPLHAALLPHSRAYMQPPGSTTPSWLDSTTNPAEFICSGLRFLGTGGQPIEDIAKYILPSTTTSTTTTPESRLEIIESTLRWRLTAPTAPDTLPCYPFQEGDAFVINHCPHVYIVGNQPRFETRLIHGPDGQSVRLIAVPRFKVTGELVLLDLESLVPELVRFEV
ncbi:dna polymerase subunit delta-2 [Acrodontium crateriforme]|uniref:DNA-directed DNA polymerase n=1 Tax=Acrodontium crateriforme TaxID=150365 RepID=A0AAQ3MA22_9PEZI|nr:dna polymerase subunit delta-2 [Acrodontium crateriforme]